MNTESMARGLGFVSIGLGAAEVLAPRSVGRAVGMPGRAGLLRAYGVRELAAGAGLLASRRRPTPWLWARVGGDALDLATLGAAVVSAKDGRRRAAAVATGAIIGVTAVDVVSARRSAERDAVGGLTAARSVTIGAPAEEVQRLWSDPATLRRLLGEKGQVTVEDDGRTRWTFAGPLGTGLSWETTVGEVRPGEVVRFASPPGAETQAEGSLAFRPAPGDWGTEATLSMTVRPTGAIDKVVPGLKRAELGTALGTALRRLKSLAETGEIPTLERNPSARGEGDKV